MRQDSDRWDPLLINSSKLAKALTSKRGTRRRVGHRFRALISIVSCALLCVMAASHDGTHHHVSLHSFLSYTSFAASHVREC